MDDAANVASDFLDMLAKVIDLPLNTTRRLTENGEEVPAFSPSCIASVRSMKCLPEDMDITVVLKELEPTVP